jgi:multimeric flavodoxin WrbA
MEEIKNFIDRTLESYRQKHELEDKILSDIQQIIDQPSHIPNPEQK